MFLCQFLICLLFDLAERTCFSEVGIAAITFPFDQISVHERLVVCLCRGAEALDACHNHVLAHPSEYLPVTADARKVFEAAEAAAAREQPVLNLLMDQLNGFGQDSGY